MYHCPTSSKAKATVTDQELHRAALGRISSCTCYSPAVEAELDGLLFNLTTPQVSCSDNDDKYGWMEEVEPSDEELAAIEAES